ncbi:MAG TPA: DUF4157 domain-containing protein [Acidimicrobiia bacterium]|nr:DUF4157 domain-containing protein [Acidimicrobiia bacterium]
MRAGDLLGPLDRPELRVRLLPVVPEQVVVRVRPAWLRRIWPRWAAAMTLPWGIYLRPDQVDADPERLGRLIAHELVHTRQWKTLGLVGFLGHYLADYLRGRLRRMGHREAYRAISLEAEARVDGRATSGPASPP